MQHIPINDDLFQKLTQRAADAGFADVSAFVEAVAENRVYVDTINDDELQASLAMCDEGMAEADAGGGQDAREAMLEIGQSLGFKRPE